MSDSTKSERATNAQGYRETDDETYTDDAKHVIDVMRDFGEKYGLQELTALLAQILRIIKSRF